MDPMASTISLLSTDTTSPSFDPKKQDRVNRPPPQKDYAAAFSALQGKYGLADASTTSVPPPLSSKKPSTPQYLPIPANPAGSTPSSSSSTLAPLPAKQQRGEKAKTPSSPLALLRVKYRSGGSTVPPSPPSSSASSDGKGSRRTEDRKIGKADAATTSETIGEA